MDEWNDPWETERLGNYKNLTPPQWLTSSLGGIVRGIGSHSIIFPILVVKFRQQAQEKPERWYRIARKLFQEEGIEAFKKGFGPHLLSVSIKQAWLWPIIDTLPEYLKNSGLGDLSQLVLTGVVIATLDAAIATPLESAKILSAVKGQSTFSLKKAFKEGWQAFPTQWSKQAVQMVTFLVSQKYLRDAYRENADERLRLGQLIQIGVMVALIASVTSAPFDFANTRRHLQIAAVTDARRLFCGWPLHLTALTAQGVSSVVLIEWLSRAKSKNLIEVQTYTDE